MTTPPLPRARQRGPWENTKPYYTPKNTVKTLTVNQLQPIRLPVTAGAGSGYDSRRMRILVDYRPALRARTGVGEWVHNLTRTWLQHPPPGLQVSVALFVSSWKDRFSPDAAAELPGALVFDKKIPVRLLTWAWNRLAWPPVERLTGWMPDIAFSSTPLLLPSRARLRAVTVYDLDFLDHPERTWGEMRRDFPALITRHVQAADAVVAISHFTADEVHRRLGVARERIVVCRPGVPAWVADAPARPAAGADGRYILFVGTLEPRKNVVGLLDAYARLVARRPDTPRLVLAGGRPPVTEAGLDARLAGPLADRLDVRGYLPPEQRLALYSQAAMLVLPSRMEGFGLPALEAMALGIPVVVSSRGALPEVVGDAGLVVDPDDAEGLADAMARVLDEPGLAAGMRARGLARAEVFSWIPSGQGALTHLAALAGASGAQEVRR